MKSLAHQTTSKLPIGMWRAGVSASGISISARIFAHLVLAPLMARTGSIRPGGAGELIARYAWERGRATYTGRRIRQLLAELIGAGLLGRDRAPAPGRHATYRAYVPGADLPRPMLIRPRGPRPRNLLGAWQAELDLARAGPP